MNQWKPLPSRLIQQACSPPVCRLFFPPLLVPELLITSLSPLCCIPRSFVIVPRKQIRKPSLSLSQPPCLFSFFFFSFVSLCLPFLCLRPLSVWSAPRRLGTLNFDPRAQPAPCSLWCHGRSKGCWEVTRGQTSSCPARISGCCKLPILPFEESASLVWRKCLLFQDVGPAFLKSFKVAPRAPIFLLG